MKIEVLREQHEAPENFQRMLELAGGTNIFGEPMYRFVWGQNRLEWVGGRWEDFDNSGVKTREVIELRQSPKYQSALFNPDRWYVERWYPPSWYGSPRAWAAKTIEIEDGRCVPALGPYPSRGDYEHFYTLEGPNGEFRGLTYSRAAWVAGIVWSSEKLFRARQEHPQHALSEKRAAFAKEKKDSRKRDLDALDSTIPAFDYQPFVSFAGC